MGFSEPCFLDTEDGMIDQALDLSRAHSPWPSGMTREQLESQHSIRQGRVLPGNAGSAGTRSSAGRCRRRGIADGDSIEVFNERGKIPLRANVSATVPAGVTASRLGWNKLTYDGQGINVLTSETLTDLEGGPAFYSALVEVR